ncbi:unnamed protein product [marine sediment metagenome]|uniref:Transcriptional coactivator p15 (PC4) C-terminal domain-containing protein n=1 Tax=marine sediment metagenome TaxID=412755 RepID=X1RX48_9ZZZZ
MMAVIDKEMKVIDEFDINDKMKLKLRVGFYGGSERIDIREYAEVNESYIPLKKGINFNIEWLGRFIEMVDKLKDI